MYKRSAVLVAAVAAFLVCASPVLSANLTKGFKKGGASLKSAGPLAFAADGVLLIGDSKAAAVVAVATGDISGNPEKVKYDVKGLGKKIAGMLATTAKGIRVVDMIVNPKSGNVYLSVSRGRGSDAIAAILKLDAKGGLSEVKLDELKGTKVVLPNPPAPGGRGRRNRRRSAITDIAFSGGKLIVAGLSNEDFASTLRVIPFPLAKADRGAGVRIYHGAHGKYETHSPIRTFTTFTVKKQTHLLAAYTCTPLVRFPLNNLKSGEKVQGITIAELGNYNAPLDMFVYSKAGKNYILMANSRRGVMKITTKDIDRKTGLADRVARGKTAGQTYDTIKEWKGVVQLDRLNKENALVMIRGDQGALSVKSIALP